LIFYPVLYIFTAMDELTPRQAQILEWIRDQIDATGMPPTRAEIADALGFRSPNAAEDHLKALARKGAIEMLPGASRGIRILGSVFGSGLPLIGRVAAGSPILAVENIELRYQLDAQLFSPRADYLLRVRGLSMKDAGILDGDLLAVHKTPEARSGQIVVARLDDEITVKRLRRRGNQVQLVAENPDFEPIQVDPSHDQFSIEGLAVGVIRNGRFN
jgi:repressor LexA